MHTNTEDRQSWNMQGDVYSQVRMPNPLPVRILSNLFCLRLLRVFLRVLIPNLLRLIFTVCIILKSDACWSTMERKNLRSLQQTEGRVTKW